MNVTEKLPTKIVRTFHPSGKTEFAYTIDKKTYKSLVRVFHITDFKLNIPIFAKELPELSDYHNEHRDYAVDNITYQTICSKPSKKLVTVYYKQKS